MNTLHKDINKIIPFGEFLRGFINQRYITTADLAQILRERGIFVLNQEKRHYDSYNAKSFIVTY